MDSNKESAFSVDDQSFVPKPRQLPFSVTEILGEQGIFARKIPHFTPREGQLNLAHKVAEALEQGKICIAEAGTGTGKTFAYLVPALLSGRVTVVSTASKALQDQLMYKDLPALFSYLELEPEFMVLKGFANYLCQKKAAEFIKKYGKSELIDDENLLNAEQLKLRKAANQLKTLIEATELALEKKDPLCDYAEVNSRFSREIVSEITMDPKLCRALGHCPFATHCFPHLARAKATSSRLVIVNHALFFAALSVDDVFDLLRPPVMLPKYQNIIFDEAHELPEIGRNFLSCHVSTEELEVLERQLQLLLDATPDLPRNEFAAAMQQVRQSFMEMTQYLHGRFGYHRRERYDMLSLIYEDFNVDNNDPTFRYQQPCDDFIRLGRNMYKALHAFRHYILDNEEFNSELLTPLSDTLGELMHTLTLLMTLDKPEQEEFGNYVGCCELLRHGFDFKLTPLEINKIFGRYLKQCEQHQLGVIMTSATLSVNQSCAKFKHDLGAEPQTEELIVHSHFDYQRQAALYISKDFPQTGDQQRLDKILQHLSPLLHATEGGIFILTTAVASVVRTAHILESLRLNRHIYQQYTDLSNTEMLQAFKQDGRAILIGTSSFWAGVDVPGQALRLVIIDKLPFDPPDDPLLRARFNWYDFKHGKKSFFDLYLPEAVINLRQGVGRLVRSDEDTGVMVICDPRLLAQGYGKTFLNSLPPMRRCNTLKQTLDFMHKVGITHG